MKTLQKILIAIIFAFTFTACFVNQPLATQRVDNNRTYEVVYLFEHDGCKVYRFFDIGGYVYFTNCNGSTTAFSNDSTKTKTVNIVSNLNN